MEPAPNTDESAGLPERSRGVWSDLRIFFLQGPRIRTRIDSTSVEGRARYADRIQQRLGVSVEDYAILNIHRIGIEAPCDFVFDELLRWEDAARCWPGNVARLDRARSTPERIDVYLFGRKRKLLAIKHDLFGLNVVPLFTMSLARVQRVPGIAEIENARYVLYECSGGYPVGIFYAYVRPPIGAEGESAESQVFLAVGFNFYGQEERSRARARIRDRVWELVHNRVTGNILNRLKQACEARWRAGPAEP